jgi:hypothetical protein
MIEFKFFKKEKEERLEFDDIVLSDIMVDEIYRLCRIQINHMDECEEKYLRENPHIDRSGEYRVPTPHLDIDDVKLPEGILSYIGVDFNEEYDNVMEHLLYFYPNGTDENNYMVTFNDDIKQFVHCGYEIIVRQNQPSNELNIIRFTVADD